MDDLSFAHACIKELEAEVSSTRKCLERIPMDKAEWKPHEKSMSFGYLALLVAEIPKWISHMIEQSEIDFATFEHFKPATAEELVNHFNENVEGAKKALAAVKVGDLSHTFYLKNNGQVVFSSPKRNNIESTINHMVHHRGQLTVYMRLNDIAVPSIYGPSADDRGF